MNNPMLNEKPYVKVEFDLSIPEQREIYEEIRNYNRQKFRSMSKYIIELLLEHAEKTKKRRQMEQHLSMEMDIRKDKKKQEEIHRLSQATLEVLGEPKMEEQIFPEKKASDYVSTSKIKNRENDKNGKEEYLDLGNVNESLTDFL